MIEIGDDLPQPLVRQLLHAAYRVEWTSPVAVWARSLPTWALDRLLDPVVAEIGLTRPRIEYLPLASPSEAASIARSCHFCVVSSADFPATATDSGSRFMRPARGLVFLESLARRERVRLVHRPQWPVAVRNGGPTTGRSGQHPVIA